MKRRPSRRLGTQPLRSALDRRLLLEPLEDRRLMASDVIQGLGVVGETYSDEFTPAEMSAGILNWVALLDERGADAGGDGTTVHGVLEPPNDPNYDPRGTGFTYNWSLNQSSHLDLFAEGSAAQLGLQIGQGLVSHAVVMLGLQEFTDLPSLSDRRVPPPEGTEYLFAWYDDLYLNDPTFDIQTGKTPLVSALSINVENLSRSGANVVLSTVPDPNDLPRFAQLYPDPAGQARVTAGVQLVNADIRALGNRLRVPVVDLYQMQKDLLWNTSGGVPVRLAERAIGGVAFTTAAGGPGTHLFKDEIHPNTAMQALIANSVMAALNQGYGTNLQLYSEQEILARIGQVGAFTGNTLNLNFNSYVQVPDETLVVLDFGAAGDPQNDFAARMAEAWAVVGGTEGSLTAGEIDQLEAGIQSQIESAFSAGVIGANNLRFVNYANLPSSVSLDGANYHRINFGLETVPGPNRNAVIGHFDQDWRNTDLNGVGFIAPEELKDLLTNLTGMTRAAKIQYMRNALSFYAVQGIGLSFGLSHTDAMARPQVTPANYADTGGVQNVDFMSGNDELGFSIDTFKNNVAFSFSPLAKAKLQMAIGLYDNRLVASVEMAADHGAVGAAQQLTLQTAAGASVKAAGVARANITAAGQKDVYRFEADAGQLITIQTLLAKGGAATLNPVVRLLDSTGAVIAVNDDTRLGFNSFDQPTGVVVQSNQSLVLNVPAPRTGTYYVEVSGSGNTVGEYDLLVATMSPNASSSPWTNPIDPLNVDNQPGIVPLDALIIINELNNPQYSDPDGRLRPPPAGFPPPYYDVNGDGYVIPLDALIVINYLNTHPVGGEGEAAGDEWAASSQDSAEVLSAADWFLVVDAYAADEEGENEPTGLADPSR